jgi:hypothetical protein
MLLKRKSRIQVLHVNGLAHKCAGTVPFGVMRRVVFMSIVGLGLAFGIFYALSWPSTVQGSRGNNVVLHDVAPGELLHVGLGNFRVAGNRDATVVTVKLNDPSAGIEIVATRVALAGNGRPSIGVLRGPQPTVEILPRAPDYVLHPKDEGGFVVTFRVLSGGSFTFKGFSITYQTGWLTRTAHLGPDVIVEAPGTGTPTPTPTL